MPQCGIQMAVYDYVKDILQAKHPDDKLGNLERLTAGEHCGAPSGLLRYYSGCALSMPLFAIMFLFFSMANISLPGTSSSVGSCYQRKLHMMPRDHLE